MLALLPGIHGLSPCHTFSCPAALLPAGSYLRSVSVPKDKVGKVTSEIHAEKSLFLNPKKTLPVLSHSLLVGFTLLLCYCYLPRAWCQSCRSRVVHLFCFVLCCRQGSPEHVGAFGLNGVQRSKVEDEVNPQ